MVHTVCEYIRTQTDTYMYVMCGILLKSLPYAKYTMYIDAYMDSFYITWVQPISHCTFSFYTAPLQSTLPPPISHCTFPFDITPSCLTLHLPISHCTFPFRIASSQVPSTLSTPHYLLNIKMHPPSTSHTILTTHINHCYRHRRQWGTLHGF